MGGQHGVCRGCGGMVVDAFCIACKKPPKTYNDIATSIDLRDQFAMAALGHIINYTYTTNNKSDGILTGEAAAKRAYLLADAMMKERDK